MYDVFETCSSPPSPLHHFTFPSMEHTVCVYRMLGSRRFRYLCDAPRRCGWIQYGSGHRKCFASQVLRHKTLECVFVIHTRTHMHAHDDFGNIYFSWFCGFHPQQKWQCGAHGIEDAKRRAIRCLGTLTSSIVFAKLIVIMSLFLPCLPRLLRIWVCSSCSLLQNDMTEN